MVLLRSCCCWWEHVDSIKRGSYASCIYSTVLAALQLIFNGWAIYQIMWLQYAPNPEDRWPSNEIEYWFPPGSVVFVFLAFGFVIAKLVVGIMLWKGIEKEEYIKSKNFILGWIITNGVFEIYIVIVTIYICGYLQYYRLYDIYFMNRGMVVGVWFGVVDTAIMFWAIICVISLYQQLEEHEYGLLRKTKQALWNFDLGMTYRTGSIGTSRPASTAYSFESLATVEAKKPSYTLDSYNVSSSAV